MHSKYNKFIIILIIALFISIIINGCWSRKELENLAIVRAIAVDKAESPDQIKLTIQIIKLSEFSKQGGNGGSGSLPYWNAQETGATFFEVIRKFTFKSPRRLYFPHCEGIYFSEEVAKEGIDKYLDLIVRDPELRQDQHILVTKGEASKLLESKLPLEDSIGTHFEKTFNIYSVTSEIIPFTVHEFLERTLSKTTSGLATIAAVDKEENPVVEGTAIFKHDKMVGELTRLETRGLLWVLNKVKGGIIVVDCPEEKGKISMEIINAESKVTPEVKNGKLHITIDIAANTNLGEQTCYQDLTTPQSWESLKKRQATIIRNEVLAAFTKAKELKADIFGFGENFHRTYPDLWKDIKDKWDDYFPHLELTINVKTEIKETGILLKNALIK